MNETYKVNCLWQDETVTCEYAGKWWTQAFDAGQKALENGAVFADLETLQGDEVTKIENIPHPALT